MAPSPSPNRSSAPVSSTVPLHEEPTPTDLLLATPPAIIKLLTLTAPVISALTTLAQLLTWSHPSFFSSLLILLSWWSICLFGQYILAYGLPPLLVLYVLSKYIFGSKAASTQRHRTRPATITPASYTQLLHSTNVLAAHVQTLKATLINPIAAQLSFVSLVPGKAAPAYHTGWLAVTSYPFYLFLTYFVPLRYIFLALGSVAILWNAPFFRTLRAGLTKSAFVRWSFRVVLAILSGGRGMKKELRRTSSGVGVPGLLGRRKGRAVVDEKPVKVAATNGVSRKEEEGEQDVQLQFTVFENQRWWVGLDWTHALLPGERASWTDPSLNPASPPASFSLPPPSSSYTPSPTRSDPNSRLKRTLEWKWLDPEWKVLRTSTNGHMSPFAPLGGAPLASSSATSGSPPVNGSPPLGTISQSMASGDSTTSLSTLSSETKESMPHVDPDELFKTWVVDEEGWQYGDNHFEKMGPKGGLGKYTRRRAWVRRAGLVERVERVAGVANVGSSSTSSSEKEKVSSTVQQGATAPRVGSLRERSASGSRDRRSRESTPVKGVGNGSASPDGAALRRRKSSGAGKSRMSKEAGSGATSAVGTSLG